jgi:3-hydroxy-9,10-secoandrosta-1,3,5(10)-triene-9,17-dione monooxygenase
VLEKTSPTIPVPEPELTATEMLARAEAMSPVLRERRTATESAGHLLDENNDAFIKAGFYRAIQPRRFGGYEFHLRDFIRIMIAVARGCPSSGWVLALTAGHPQMLSRFAERTQAEIYGNAGDVRAPLRPVPGGQAEKCDGGYLVSGAWECLGLRSRNAFYRSRCRCRQQSAEADLCVVGSVGVCHHR